MRKITVEVPNDLLTAVQDDSGLGLSDTIRHALEQMRQRQVQNAARKLRGKITFAVDLMKLRDDEE